MLALALSAIITAQAPGVHPISGRRFAPVMGYQGADWLERTERDEEEAPDVALRVLNISKGASVADIGAGSGYITEKLAARVGSTGMVFANDVQPQMLNILARRLDRSKITNVTLIEGTLDDPRLPLASVDLVLMVDVYHELEDGPGMLAALRRALRPGGRMVIVDRAAAEFDPAAHAIPETRVVADAAAAGLRVRERVDLPRQFALVLE